MFSGSYQAENATIAGICKRQTCNAYADPISILEFALVGIRDSHIDANLSAMFPFMAKDMAFMNSVVLGTKAKRVIPRNFSSIPEPFKITSTTSTSSSLDKY